MRQHRALTIGLGTVLKLCRSIHNSHQAELAAGSLISERQATKRCLVPQTQNAARRLCLMQLIDIGGGLEELLHSWRAHDGALGAGSAAWRLWASAARDLTTLGRYRSLMAAPEHAATVAPRPLGGLPPLARRSRPPRLRRLRHTSSCARSPPPPPLLQVLPNLWIHCWARLGSAT